MGAVDKFLISLVSCAAFVPSCSSQVIISLFSILALKSPKICFSLSVLKNIQVLQPDEIYNLGAQSHVGVSFEVNEYTANVDAIGTLRILDSIKTLESIGFKYQYQIGMLMNKYIGLSYEGVLNKWWDKKSNCFRKVEPILVFQKV